MTHKSRFAIISLGIIVVLAMTAGAALANGRAKPGAGEASYLGAERTRPGGPPVSTGRFSPSPPRAA